MLRRIGKISALPAGSSLQQVRTAQVQASESTGLTIQQAHDPTNPVSQAIAQEQLSNPNTNLSKIVTANEAYRQKQLIALAAFVGGGVVAYIASRKNKRS